MLQKVEGNYCRLFCCYILIMSSFFAIEQDSWLFDGYMPFVLVVGAPRSVDETPAIATEHVQWLCDTVQQHQISHLKGALLIGTTSKVRCHHWGCLKITNNIHYLLQLNRLKTHPWYQNTIEISKEKFRRLLCKVKHNVALFARTTTFHNYITLQQPCRGSTT